MRSFAQVSRLVCLVLSLAVTAAARQAAAPAADAPPSLAEAEALVNAGKLDPAIDMLAALRATGNTDPKVDFLLGLAYYRKSDYVRALPALGASVDRSPADSQQMRESVHLRGLSNYYLGRIKDALPDLERVVAWSPDNLEIAYALGVGYVQTLDPDRARQVFARVFGVPQDSASAHLVLAQIMVHHGSETLAEKELVAALALDPKLPEANRLLGELEIYRADIDGGIELLRKEIAINPSNAMAHYRLGEALTRQQKWDEAIGPLQRSIWLNPFFSGPFIVLGKVYSKKGDLRNAADLLGRAVEMDPKNASAHYLLGQVLQQAGRTDAAKKEFDEAKRLQGDPSAAP